MRVGGVAPQRRAIVKSKTGITPTSAAAPAMRNTVANSSSGEAICEPQSNELTPLGLTLGGAFCGVWVWAADNLRAVERVRRKFDDAKAASRK